MSPWCPARPVCILSPHREPSAHLVRPVSLLLHTPAHPQIVNTEFKIAKGPAGKRHTGVRVLSRAGQPGRDHGTVMEPGPSAHPQGGPHRTRCLLGFRGWAAAPDPQSPGHSLLVCDMEEKLCGVPPGGPGPWSTGHLPPGGPSRMRNSSACLPASGVLVSRPCSPREFPPLWLPQHDHIANCGPFVASPLRGSLPRGVCSASSYRRAWPERVGEAQAQAQACRTCSESTWQQENRICSLC